MTQGDFTARVEAVDQALAQSNCNLLLWIVSAQGGTDQDGPFFLDLEGNKIHQYQDWINPMTDGAAVLKGKRMIFFPSVCSGSADARTGVSDWGQEPPEDLSKSLTFFRKKLF